MSLTLCTVFGIVTTVEHILLLHDSFHFGAEDSSKTRIPSSQFSQEHTPSVDLTKILCFKKI